VDFLDALKVVDDAVDAHLSETANLVHKGVVYQDIRGPLDRDVFTDDTGSSHSGTLSSTFSVQSSEVPSDPRGGILVCRDEQFDVIDIESPKDGRIILMLRKIKDIDPRREHSGFPYTLPVVLG